MGKSNEDELRAALDETAKEVSGMIDNPRSWHSWIVYLLERLEDQATHDHPAYTESYKEMLSALQDEIRNRLRTGGW